MQFFFKCLKINNLQAKKNYNFFCTYIGHEKHLQRAQITINIYLYIIIKKTPQNAQKRAKTLYLYIIIDTHKGDTKKGQTKGQQTNRGVFVIITKIKRFQM